MGRTAQAEVVTGRPVRIDFLVVELMNRLLDVPVSAIDAEIDETLAVIGKACGFDRAFVFSYDDATGYSNTHEWVAPGIAAMKQAMQGKPAELMPLWHAALSAGEIVAIPDRDKLPEGSRERAFLQGIGVFSSLKVPLCDDNRLFGVIGFDRGRKDLTWAEEDVFLLTSIGRAVSSVLLRAEAAAKEAASRNHLAATLKALPDLVIEVTTDGRIVAVHSDKLPWLSGLVRAGIGRSAKEVLPEPVASALTDLLADPMAGDAVQMRRVGVSTLVTPHRYDVSVAPLPAGSDGEERRILVIRDVSAADRSSEMTSFREGQFTAFFEMCPHPILLNDFDTAEILDGNRAFKEVFGLDPQASINLQVEQILPVGARRFLEDARCALGKSGVYGPVEAVFRRKSGGDFPAITRCFMSVDPNGRRLVWSLIEDVTEIRAKEAEFVAKSQALEATRSRFMAAIEALDDGFAVFDAEDRLVIWNTQYTKVFAAIADQIVEGALYDDLLRAAIEHDVFGKPGERDDENLQRRLDRPLTEIWDNEDAFADGRLIWVRERATPARETVGLYEDVTARRLADRRLQQVVDSGEIAVWDWDADHGFSTIHDRWGKMLGLGAAVSLDALIDLMHPADRMTVLTTQRQLFLEGREDFSLRCRMQHRNGGWVWLLSRGRVSARRADGSPRRISGITLDVSAQTKAEQRLTRVIEGAQVGTWEYHYQKDTVRVNDQWAGMLGYSVEDLLPLTKERWLSLLHPDDLQLIGGRDRQLVHGEILNAEDEFRLRHRDGHWVWVLSRGQVTEWDAKGKPLQSSGIHLDITAAKALETALARERDTLARTMETSVSGIVAIDDQGRVVFANAAAERVFGKGISSGDGLLDLLGLADATGTNGGAAALDDLPMHRALAGLPGLHEARHELHWPNGESRVVAATAARLSAPGTDLAVVCTFTDITDEVQAETRLRAAMTAAEAASRAKSDFLAAMSHEIRTPLNGVLGMATVLGGRLADPTEQAMLRVIRDSGEHLLGVINDILDLAKIEAGQLTLDLRPIRLPEVLSRVAALHQTTADEKRIRLLTRCFGGAKDEVRQGDEMRLIQILHNLLGNALKFTDKGTVRVDIDCSSSNKIYIAVHDTGIGMTEAEITRAFDEFSQGMGGSRRSHVGTGLGLPIVRRLARLMRGDIRLSSVPGEGVRAEVELEVPVMTDKAGSVEVCPVPRLPAMKVLAAEDNATNRIILQSMLQALGVQAVIVTDGNEALNRYQRETFDAVLLDIAMPGMDGLETLAALNSLACTRGAARPKTVAVTANAMTHQVNDYLDQGFTAVVAKPIRMDMLGKALRQCLDSVGPVDQTAP
jgi:PAS domain S-box-containing protein